MAKKLTKKDVLHVAKLSNLNLSDSEVEKFLPQLSKVVEFVSQLSEVDTDGVQIAGNPSRLNSIYRQDIVNSLNILPVDKATSGTEDIHNDLFKVPAILEGRTDK